MKKKHAQLFIYWCLSCLHSQTGQCCPLRLAQKSLCLQQEKNLRYLKNEQFLHFLTKIKNFSKFHVLCLFFRLNDKKDPAPKNWGMIDFLSVSLSAGFISFSCSPIHWPACRCCPLPDCQMIYNTWLIILEMKLLFSKYYWN